MTANEKETLESIKEMESAAPKVGLCSIPFKMLYQQFSDLIFERDNLKARVEVLESA